MSAAWLDYPKEIGPRRTPAKKKRAEAALTPNVVPLRDPRMFAAQVEPGVRQFLDRNGCSAAEPDGMCQALTKAMLLHVTSGSRDFGRAVGAGE